MTEAYIIENFIDYYTSNDKERERMKRVLRDYIECNPEEFEEERKQ